MTFFRKTGSALILLFMAVLFIQPHDAEAQLLKKLKRKAQEKIEKKAEEKLDRALESSIDTVYSRVEGLFGIRKRGSGANEVMSTGKAGGFATLSFLDERYSHDDFQDVVCTFYKNGVSIDAIVNERYGLLLELINVPVTPSGHQGSYETQAFSADQGMLSNFEYYTRPSIPARVGSVLKKGTLTIVSLDQSSVYFSFNGDGGNAETDELLSMNGTVKLDFSYIFQNDGMIENNYSGKRAVEDTYQQVSEDREPTSETSMSEGMESMPQAQQAMEMMQQMMGSAGDVEVADTYSFDYLIEYEMEGEGQDKVSYSAWVASESKVTMINSTDGDDMMIMDDEREAFISLDEREKIAYVLSSKLSQSMVVGQSRAAGESLEGQAPRKTGKTKSILGYESHEYLMEVPNGQGKIVYWISEEVGVKMNGTLPGVSGFTSGAGLGSDVEGLLMEMHTTEASSGEEYHLVIKSIEKNKKRVNMSDYKVSKGFK